MKVFWLVAVPFGLLFALLIWVGMRGQAARRGDPRQPDAPDEERNRR